VSWQVVPAVLIELMAHPDKEKAGRVMEAMLPMKKLDIAELQRAYAGEAAGSRR
jgi:predicted 3-demethylubiquinone-9 3-methyltransferase (glyoxalase superfamily)